jgi:AcrR family transcriptional regulator
MSRKTEKNARNRIVDTALDLFYRQGYLATGINQIISESQVAKATFYTHFPSKEALCIEYLRARHILWMGWLKESVENEGNSRDKLWAVFGFLKRWMIDSNFRGCAFLNIASEVPSVETEIRNEVKKHKNELQRFLQNIIEEIMGSNASSIGLDVPHIAKMIYVLVEGAIVASQNYNETWPIESAQEAAKILLML